MAANGSVRTQLRQAEAVFASVSREPKRDAALLLCRALAKDHAWLLAHSEAPLTEPQLARFRSLVDRRAQHEPIQYILGEQEFWGLRLQVAPAVLIPRPETEHLVEAALARLPADQPVRIADVGTGSGALAIALAHTLPDCTVDALDISPEALAVAEGNVAAHGLAERVKLRQSDLLAAVHGQRFHCVVTNPPYVAEGELLDKEVRDWEPWRALFGGSDGLEIYRRLLPEAASALLDGGVFLGELGFGQQEALATLFTGDPRWTAPEFLPDLRGVPRVVVATLRTAAER